MSDYPRDITFIVALLVTTGVLIWALKLVSKALTQPTSRAGILQGPLINTILAEEPNDPTEPEKGSFSRTAGMIGATGLASVTIGIGYWIIYGLFYDEIDPESIKNVGWYYLAGSALFFPYAFNQLASIFNPKVPG
jgi:hypothetical protein